MSVTMLFPRTARPELKQHYVAEGRDAIEVRRLMRLLQSTNDVVYAQREVRRGPR